MKKIVDVCCGGKMFWWNKNHPDVLYLDKRSREKGFMTTRKNFEVKPDKIADFRNLAFLKSNSFKMVVFDPPHTIRAGEGGILGERYGRLDKKHWKEDLTAGFKECWRILGEDGVLIFKWAECDKKLKDIIPCFPADPLFGSRVGSRGETIWLCFMKLSTFNPQPKC